MQIYTMSPSAVLQFYNNANIFLTGGTGFLGMGLIEKILRSLPESGNVYLLMRAKKGKTIEQRLEEMCKNEVFESVLAEGTPAIFKRLIPIEGDVGADRLGISDSDRRRLIENVHVVIHSAATLDFNETLQTTVNVNLLGTRRVLQLAADIKDLRAFVQVSSAYVNATRTEADEVLYAVASADITEDVISMVASLGEEALREITPKVLGKHPNTYTFTKHLAEHEVQTYAETFPCAIVRPSMIQPAWKEPVAGWTMSKNGPQGFLMGAAKGVVRRLPGLPHIICDYIPVDCVINQLLVAAYDAHHNRVEGKLKVFHCTTSTCNPFRWELVAATMNSYVNENPLKSSAWYPHLKFLPSMFLFKIAAILFHFIPAYALDTVARLAGARPILVRLHTNIWNSLNLLQGFIFTEWKFHNPKTLALADSLGAYDAAAFGFDVRSLDWDRYFYNMTLGVRRYLNGESLKTLPVARKRNQILFGLHVALHVFLYGIGWWTMKSLLGMSWLETAILLPIAYKLMSFI